MSTDLYYLIAVSIFPVSAAIIAAIVLIAARRDDRRDHHTPAE